jgi:hypothetical protein
MLEFLPITEWTNVSQVVYDATVAGNTTAHGKPVIEKGSDRTVRICKSYKDNNHCLDCTDVFSCPVGKLAMAKGSSNVNPEEYL